MYTHTHSSLFSVANITLLLAGATAAFSPPLTFSTRLPAEVFRRVEDFCPCLNAQDLSLHQFIVEPTNGHQLTVGPLFSHTTLINHYDVVCLLHCAQPMGDHQHCVLLNDVVQSLLNLHET